MSESDQEDRTEEATPRKKEEAKKKGQIPRSKDLNTALLMLGAAIGCAVMNGPVLVAMKRIALHLFSFTQDQIYAPDMMVREFGFAFAEVFLALVPFMVFLLIIALIAPLALGGWIMNLESAAPKFNRMSPMAGFKRMFGMNAAVELAKSIGKFLVVGVSAALLLRAQFNEYMSLGTESLEASIGHGLQLVLWTFIGVSASLLLIAIIDVPYQLHSFAKQIRMTKQEIRDEYKETEGRPEVKGKIRQMQREMSRRRMMQKVPDADVVITNPEHYAVALKYDATKAGAPRLLAKGADQIAQQIRKVASDNAIPIIEAPPLARAVYHSTELDKEIPEGLYLAVAQLLAYVYQLKTWRAGRGTKPKTPGDYPIPPDLRR